MKIKSFVFAWSTIALGFLMAPVSSSAYHSNNYYYENNNENMCSHCHPGGPGGGNFPDCMNCHNAESPVAPPYSVDIAPMKQTHSNAVIGSDKYGDWSRECLDCHDPHHNNGMTKRGGLTNDEYKLVKFTGDHMETANGETTVGIAALNIIDLAWKNPDKWINKTSEQRGLVLLNKTRSDTFWYKVIGVTIGDDGIPTEITFINTQSSFGNPAFYKPLDMSLVYGQQINDEVEVDGQMLPVTFGGPRDMANDESGTGFDVTADGICQVCHTQTTYWRNDGSRADHFNGWRCTICHTHDQGFKAVTPEGCICPEGESCNE